MNRYWTKLGVFEGEMYRYCQWGELHRENDLPAIIYANGKKEWWVNGKQHRDAGPAVECLEYGKHWYRWSSLHRIDGPAVELLNGFKAWYLNGYAVSLERFIQRTPHLESDAERLLFYLKWK